MRKLRLLLWKQCPRNCDGCCNKDWDIDSLPFAKDFSKYDQILLTGGEPMLYPRKVFECIKIIRSHTDASIYMYTALVKNTIETLGILSILNGITVTLHEQEDVVPFNIFNEYIKYIPWHEYSLRLNVFKEVNIENVDTRLWKLKDKMKWIPNCPLPENEELLKYNGGKRSND